MLHGRILKEGRKITEVTLFEGRMCVGRWFSSYVIQMHVLLGPGFLFFTL